MNGGQVKLQLMLTLLLTSAMTSLSSAFREGLLLMRLQFEVKKVRRSTKTNVPNHQVAGPCQAEKREVWMKFSECRNFSERIIAVCDNSEDIPTLLHLR
jgi:hypothetical protein